MKKDTLHHLLVAAGLMHRSMKAGEPISIPEQAPDYVELIKLL